MPFNRRERALIAFGGFILFIGFIILALAILGAPGIELIEVDIFFQHIDLVVIISATVGVLDIIAGLLLMLSARWR